VYHKFFHPGQTVDHYYQMSPSIGIYPEKWGCESRGFVITIAPQQFIVKNKTVVVLDLLTLQTLLLTNSCL
jgi:hypothetical protein